MRNHQIWITSDTHLGHKKIIEFMPLTRAFSSVEEHDEAIVDLWNSTVRPKDTVWHLGDAVFGASNLPLLGRLHGIKKLVMGNHDHYGLEVYSRYFQKVYGCIKFQNVILTHIPVHPDQLLRYSGNVHGHLHHQILDDARYFNVCMDHHGLRPIPLELALSGIKAETERLTKENQA